MQSHSEMNLNCYLPKLSLTPQIANKVLQHHLAVGLDVGTVHVCVEEDDGEGQDEDGVWVVELLHHIWIAHAVALAKEKEQNKGVHNCNTYTFQEGLQKSVYSRWVLQHKSNSKLLAISVINEVYNRAGVVSLQ